MKPASIAPVLSLVAFLAPSWIAHAAPTAEPFPASTHVVAVPDPSHIVVGHGRKDHFPADAKNLVVSPRGAPRPDRNNPPVDFGVVIALADVERVDETTTLLRLRDVKQSPKLGDHVTWSLVVPKAQQPLRDSALFWAATLDIGARNLALDRDFFILRDFFADPGTAARVMREMLAEIHGHADLARGVYATPIDSGAYKGRLLGDIFASTTERDLTAFWDYVVSEPWNYTTYSFRLVDIFATWIARGAPSAPEVKTQRQLVTLKIELGQMLRQQQWEASEKRLIEILRLLPGDPTLRVELDQVSAIRRADAALVRDPGDDAAAWVRARALAIIGLYPTAIMAFEALIVRDYRVDDAKLQLGYSLCGAARWTECERHFAELIKARGKRREPDPELERWYVFARTRGTQGGNQPNADSASHIATARALEDEGGWEGAVASWRNAVTLAQGAGDVASVRQAELGLARAARRLALKEAIASGVAALREHRVEDASNVLVTVRGDARSMGEPEAGTHELEALAAAAHEVGELDFERIVLAARVEDVPAPCVAAGCKARGGALADLAERVGEADDTALAEALFAEAIKLAPESVSVRAKRSWFFAELGRWSDAYSAAFMGAGQSVAMTFTMVRATAARGRLDDAMEYADRLGRKTQELGLVAPAVHRLAGAQKALAAVGANGSEATARILLRRIRALVEVGLERIAMAELPGLASFPALHRDAAWAIARPVVSRPVGADLFPLADRLQAARIAMEAATPERARTLAVLTARAAITATLGGTAQIASMRLELARALLADGAFHEAWANARANGEAAAVGLAKQASEGVRAELLLTHAREARVRGDAKPQRALAGEARTVFTAIGATAQMLAAALLECEALLTSGLQKDAYQPIVDGLLDARRDGNPERIRAFEALLARLSETPSRDAVRELLHLAPLAADLRTYLDSYAFTLRTHLRECRLLDDDRCVARTQEQLGLVAIQQGRVTDARAALDEAAAGFTQQNDGPAARRVAMAIVRIHRLRSELALAASKAGEVLAAAVDDGDGVAEREALLELGSLALSQGDLAAARTWLAAARDAALRGNDELAVARADADLGRAEFLLGGDLAKSLTALEHALARFEKRGASGDALGARIDLAEALLLQSAELSPRTPRTRGVATRKVNRPRSERAAARALELVSDGPRVAAALGRDVTRLRALLALAAARLETRNPKAAGLVLAEAATIATRIELDDLLARTSHLQAKVELALGHREEAARMAQIAANVLAKSLASGTLPLGRNETQAVFQQAADLLFEVGRHEDALELLELQRTATEARTFDLDRLRALAHPALAADLARYADARARTDAVQARLREDADTPEQRDTLAHAALIKLAAASQAELAPLAQRLEQEYPAHWKALARDPTSLASDRRRLPKGTILVEYFVTSDALYLFVVHPGRAALPTAETPTTLAPITALRVAIDATELSDTIGRYRKLLATDARLAEPLGRELYAWLLAPVADFLPPAERSASTIILLPHGPLFEVPFAALVSSALGAPVRYAIQDWRLAIASASTLAPLLAGPRKLAVLGPVLGLADPDGSLPEARKELDRMPAAIRATILRGAEATEERFLALSSDHRIVHFATHGTLAHDPLDSSLLLASGRLTVGRIAGLDGLRGKVALVFLSACQSATEAGGSDLEALSLAEGFAMAGVPTLIGSLWDVDDRATRFLVEAFYKALAAGGRDTLGALRDAQLTTLDATIDGQRPFADPRFWSAFQLIGDFR